MNLWSTLIRIVMRIITLDSGLDPGSTGLDAPIFPAATFFFAFFLHFSQTLTALKGFCQFFWIF